MRFLERVFGFNPATMTLRTEVMTGFTTFLTMIYVLALFFSPLFLLIPSAATSGALVMVGVLMIREVKEIDFSDFGEAFAAFITILGMVLCYSIADGVCLGMLSYTIVKLCTGKVKQVSWVMMILSLLFLGYFCIG